MAEQKDSIYESCKLSRIADRVDQIKTQVDEIRSEVALMHPKLDHLMAEVNDRFRLLPPEFPSEVEELDELQLNESVQCKIRRKGKAPMLSSLENGVEEEVPTTSTTNRTPTLQELFNKSIRSSNSLYSSSSLWISKSHSENTPTSQLYQSTTMDRKTSQLKGINTNGELQDRPAQDTCYKKIEKVEDSKSKNSVPTKFCRCFQRKQSDKVGVVYVEELPDLPVSSPIMPDDSRLSGRLRGGPTRPLYASPESSSSSSDYLDQFRNLIQKAGLCFTPVKRKK